MGPKAQEPTSQTVEAPSIQLRSASHELRLCKRQSEGPGFGRRRASLPRAQRAELAPRPGRDVPATLHPAQNFTNSLDTTRPRLSRQGRRTGTRDVQEGLACRLSAPGSCRPRWGDGAPELRPIPVCQVPAWARCVGGSVACRRRPRPGPHPCCCLRRTYSPGFCEEERCTTPPVSAFTIHGLWPEYSNGGWPEFCPEAAAGAAGGGEGALPAAADQGAALRCEWPSFAGSDDSFWDHEWTKHGTCSERVTGPRPAFFETVLALNQRYDLQVGTTGSTSTSTSPAMNNTGGARRWAKPP